MKQSSILTLAFLVTFFGQGIFAQTLQSVVDAENRARQQAREQEQDRNRLNGYNDKGFIPDRDMSPVPPSLYKGREKELKSLEKAFERTRNLLDVPEIYYKNYKFPLRDEKVRLARLQSEKDCYGKFVVSTEQLEKCVNVVPVSGGGSLYSFKSKLNYPLSYEGNSQLGNYKPALSFDNEGDWWSLHFTDNKFIVQNISVRGIISEIGDVDIKNINLLSKELEFLNNFKQKATLSDIAEQSKELKNGIEFNDFFYSSSVAVKLNSTYVLRSINYRSLKLLSDKRLTQKQARKLADKRADMTVAFKVVGREDDGSVVILWKELRAQPLSEFIKRKGDK